MRILGIASSYRILGNTDILMRAALMRAKELGADVAAICLPRLELKFCKACYHCFWEDCGINDDVEWVFDEMEKSDGVIISTPTYILSIPGALKLLIDRLLSLYRREDAFEGRPAGVMVAYGVKGWSGLALETTSTFLLSAGYRIVDILKVRAAVPGEVLLMDSVIERARSLGERVYRAAASGSQPSIEIEGNRCPVCGSDALIIGDETVKCPICDITGKIYFSDGKVKIDFPDEAYENSRWSKDRRLEHLEYLVSSVNEYMDLRGEILKRVSAYKEFNPYIKPDRSQ